jgi:hypothetical protein
MFYGLGEETIETTIRKWFFRTKDTLRKKYKKMGRLDELENIAELQCGFVSDEYFEERVKVEITPCYVGDGSFQSHSLYND